MLNYIKRLNSILKHPANKNRKIQSLYQLIQWQLTNKLIDKKTEIDAFGYKMIIYSPTVARRFVYYTACADYDETSFIRRFLKERDRFLDIGANIGIYTLLAASIVKEGGHVDAFEPCPSTYSILKENINRNHILQVSLHAVALGEEPGTVKFTPDLDGTNHIITSNSRHENFIAVPCQTLDQTFADNAKNYAMAKLDVEGVELSVLRGANSLLSRNNPPVLLLEINGLHKRYGHQSFEIIYFLKSKGYDMAIYTNRDNQITFIDEPKPGIHNYLFISKKAIDWVKNRIAQ